MPRWTKKQADELRRQRENLGLSQAELADKAGISAGTISALENRVHDSIHQETLDRLDEVLGDEPETDTRNGDDTDGHNERLVIELGPQKRKRIEKALEQAHKKIENLWIAVTDVVLEKLGKLDERKFESEFLEKLLTTLGFTKIEITRPVKDKGVDAHCVNSQGKVVHVSAKRWQQNVGAKHVREIRGTGGDLALLVCLTASKPAHDEAAMSGPGLIPVCILSEDHLVRACLKAGLVPGIELRKEYLPSVSDLL